MWRPILAFTLLLTLALGIAADAKCRTCIQPITAEHGDGVVVLRALAMSDEGFTLPGTVKLTIDGNQGDLAMAKVESTTYNGLPAVAYRAEVPTSAFPKGVLATLTGRIDIAGDVFAWTTMVGSGTGTTQLLVSGRANTVPQASAIATIAPTLAPAATAAPAPAPATSTNAAPALAATAALGIAALGWLGRRRIALRHA